jgi:5-methylcytosine-specific restriction enzyme B
MSLAKRQQQFVKAIQDYFGMPAGKNPNRLFGVSNSAKIIEGGVLAGVTNLDTARDPADDFVFACVINFPPEDEVYFGILVRGDRQRLHARLAQMKTLAVSNKAVEYSGAESEESEPSSDESGSIKYAVRNNNVRVYIARDGKLYFRNASFWNSLTIDLAPFGPGVEADEIVVALYPPTASARRSLLAREFVGYLGSMAGRAKVHELRVWADELSLNPLMRRMPVTIPIEEIEQAVAALGGYYPGGEIARFHAALNFLPRKHFVILAGLSGTGKTQLALKYARAVHGVAAADGDDPLLFVCPVRPEWTDPTGLTGYNDYLSNRYIVPPFLEALLVATAHRESPVFVVLDEMNLARVEYYFSDILSAMETGHPLQLHSSGVPLEGTTGTNIRAELPIPDNLFIIGTINIDETTNPVSDKVLDRASVIDMSQVDLPGFLADLEKRDASVTEARAGAEAKLVEIYQLLAAHGLGFGYRVAEEFVRYHAFAAAHLKGDSTTVTDELLIQKILVKLRGAERQRPMLVALRRSCEGLPRSLALIDRLVADLDEFGSFQVLR